MYGPESEIALRRNHRCDGKLAVDHAITFSETVHIRPVYNPLLRCGSVVDP